MAKRVFFSFHYDDVINFRANNVRNNWVLKKREDAGYFDNSIWEATKTKGKPALKNLIHEGLQNSSVTAVLIGSGTYERHWVRYEIFHSVYKANRIIGIHLNNLLGKERVSKPMGPNPFEYVGLHYSADGTTGTPYHYDGRAWVPFADYPAYKLNTIAPEAKRSTIIPFTNDYKVYDWVTDDGNANMATWVDQ